MESKGKAERGKKMMKLFDLVTTLEPWFLAKDKYLAAAGCNNNYEYEIIKETEKAIQIQIYSSKKTINNWTKWIPKSVIAA